MISLRVLNKFSLLSLLFTKISKSNHWLKVNPFAVKCILVQDKNGSRMTQIEPKNNGFFFPMYWSLITKALVNEYSDLTFII